jgi:hypothetical protein
LPISPWAYHEPKGPDVNLPVPRDGQDDLGRPEEIGHHLTEKGRVTELGVSKVANDGIAEIVRDA